MKIEKIVVHNWRSIKDLEVNFQDIMVFIGQNNHGKSNVLSSLLFFFGEIACVDEDFNKESDELYVEITFSDLNEEEKSQFFKYLTESGKIEVRKEVRRGESAEYHGYCQIPTEEWLKEENVSNYRTREAMNTTPLSELVPPGGQLTKEKIKEAQRQYIAANQGNVQFERTREEANFLGQKTLPSGIFGRVHFIPAVKNASEEFNVRGKSIFGQLLTSIINEMSTTNEGYQEIKQKIKELTNVLNKKTEDGTVNTNRPAQISRFEELIETELGNWDTKIDIEITPPDVDESLRLGTSVWVDDGVQTDVSRKGNGLQRSLIFALIKTWVKISHERSISTEGVSIGSPSKTTYFIFEEPELYLHPQAQRELYSSLKQLSKLNNQVLLSTHSSSFIDLRNYKSICVVHKENLEQGTRAFQCTAELFPTIDEKNQFNATYWINPDRGELFLAKKVLLLEGQTEKTVIPRLAKMIEVFRYDYTLIDCGGKECIPVFLELLNKFKIPYVVVYDKDHQKYRDSNDVAVADKRSNAIEDKIDSSLGVSVVLENDIEEEIGIISGKSKNKAYAAYKHIADPSFSISESLKGKIEKIFN